MSDVICLSSSDEENEEKQTQTKEKEPILTGNEIVDLTFNSPQKTTLKRSPPTHLFTLPPSSSAWDDNDDLWGASNEVKNDVARPQSQIVSPTCEPRDKKRKTQSQQESLQRDRDVEEVDEKQRKKEEKEAAKRAKAEETNAKRIARQVTASFKSKRELHMFCHVSRKIIQNFGQDVETQLRNEFESRKIGQQLVFEDSWTEQVVEYRRNKVEIVYNLNGTAAKNERMVPQHVIVRVLKADELQQRIVGDSLSAALETDRQKYAQHCTMIIYIVYGKFITPIHKDKYIETHLDIFTSHNAHILRVEEPSRLAAALARIHRSLANLARAELFTEGDYQITHIKIKRKESREKEGEERMTDVWDAMLAQLPLMSHAYRRALVKAYPNPMEASDRFVELGKEGALKEIANVVAENGRRVGPALARRIYLMLTDEGGEARLFVK